MNNDDRELDFALAEAEQENRLLRARNERLENTVVEYEALIRDLTDALRAQAMPPAPMECKTDAEKIAYAFGWNKCMELNRRMNGDHRSFREVYIPDWPDTKSGMILRLDLERANKHGDWVIPYADFPLKLKEKNNG